jgi:lauroyl/myristoyl acyltransferase
MIYLLNCLRLLMRPVFRLPAPAAIYIMKLAGEATYRIARLTPFKKTVAANYKLVFPEADAGLLADKLLRNVSHAVFEIICAPYFGKNHFSRLAKVEGLDNLDLALANRRGAICLSMHTGNYELMTGVLAARGYHMTAVMKSPPGDRLYEFLNRSRRFKGTQLINILDSNMYRECLQALAHDRCVGILVDTGALEGRHEMMPFLGHQVPIATGWTTLAQRAEAPIVPFFSKREGGQMVMVAGEAHNIYGDNKAEVMETIRQFYEHMVKLHPDQWAIFLNEHEVKRMMGL